MSAFGKPNYPKMPTYKDYVKPKYPQCDYNLRKNKRHRCSDYDQDYIYSGNNTDADFENGKRNGKGYEYREGEEIYFGDFKDDKRHGVGTLWKTHRGAGPLATLFFFGQFKDGNRVEGIHYYLDNNHQVVREEGIFASKGYSTYLVKKKKTRFSQTTSPLKSEFIKLSLLERKKIQEKLKEKGLYLSSIDGLYGTNTKLALEAFNNNASTNLDSKKRANIKTLFSSLLAIKQQVANREKGTEK